MTVTSPPVADGVRLRLVRDDDLAGIELLLNGLSPEARYRRWFTAVTDLSAAARWAVHPPGGLGFVALAGEEIVGHGALVRSGPSHAEVAFEVAKPWRHHGIATRLLGALELQAREMGIETLDADVLSFNADMLRVFSAHGCTKSNDGGVVHVTLQARGVDQLSSSSPRSSA